MPVLQLGLGSAYPNRAEPCRRPTRQKKSGHGRGINCLQQVPTTAVPSRTQRIMERISVSGEVGGAGGAYSYEALKRLDRVWSGICSSDRVLPEPQEVVSRTSGLLNDSELAGKAVDTFDVIICGGTLGIFIATALSCKGLRVGVVERNLLKGREQEWNISKKELLELVKFGILEEEDIDLAVAAEFNPAADGKILSSRLIIDATGNFSPIVKQIRGGARPDGVCLVVGSCARGFSDNSYSDVIYSSSSVKHIGESKVQPFWEAFPAGSGPNDRTTYMFTYVDPQPGCPKLEELLEAYWDLMPKYQGVSLDNLEILRVIYGIFPTYRGSPLPAAFDRVLQFGDASGIQSPVSFGGFGSLTRHLGRLSEGIYEALRGDFLDLDSLSLLNPYMPNLSASWLFQRAMSAKQQTNVSSDFINELLCINFQCMQRLGDPVLRPFLQDVIQFWPLTKTLGLVMLTKPQILPSIFNQVGIPVLLDWSGHFFMLGLYTFLSTFLDPLIRPLVNSLPPKTKYEWKRRLEAWRYGSGLDYEL